MRLISLKAIAKTAVLGAAVLLLGTGAASAQPQQVNLTAGASSITLPDGSNVPMWGYTCGTGVTGSTATCRSSAATGWTSSAAAPATGATWRRCVSGRAASSSSAAPS